MFVCCDLLNMGTKIQIQTIPREENLGELIELKALSSRKTKPELNRESRQ